MIRSSHLTRFQFACGLVAIASLAGCGKTADDALDPATAVDGVLMFTDCEAGAKDMIPGPLEFNGGWYTFDDHKDCGNDAPEVGTFSPDPLDEAGGKFEAYGANPAPPLEGSQTKNTKGVHLIADAHTNFAGGVGVALKAGPKAIDLTTEKLIGVRFWAKAAATTAIDVKLTDTVSEPNGGICAENEFKKGCPGVMINGMVLANKDQGCFDAPLKSVEVGTEWKEYRVFFTKAVKDDPATPAVESGGMARGGWGVDKTDGAAFSTKDALMPIRVNEAYQFQIQVTDPFEMWLDNFGFIIQDGVADTGLAN